MQRITEITRGYRTAADRRRAIAQLKRQGFDHFVEYRDTHGPFKKPDELRKVEGVGNGLWERNRTRIVIK